MKITVYVATTEVEGERAVSGHRSNAERTEFLIDLMRTLGKDRVSPDTLETAIAKFQSGEEHVEEPWDMVRHDNLDGVWLDDVEIDFALPAPISEALKNASAAIGLLDDQISQMEGMFSDEDGQIAGAREEGDEACEQIEAVLAHYETGAPLPAPEIYITMDGGLIEDVYSTSPLVGASYTVIDYDVDGAEEVQFIERADGTVTEACIGGGSVGEFTSKIVDDAEGEDE